MTEAWHLEYVTMCGCKAGVPTSNDRGALAGLNNGVCGSAMRMRMNKLLSFKL